MFDPTQYPDLLDGNVRRKKFTLIHVTTMGTNVKFTSAHNPYRMLASYLKCRGFDEEVCIVDTRTNEVIARYPPMLEV